ncbi:hypothetical protein [Corynebacterium lactis]|uniref:DUF2567 domain-containing protein n=1 Tax=Corynebacterium lactis RW2-5 TaxID=1408189 RepID=A0A0K2H3G3_9CORY|nr:hypothetical protein [Corynebacterium lactis]ALA68579.1 hypothetical protein CLAC_07655 [Corynebacterium lactis RW2-5]
MTSKIARDSQASPGAQAAHRPRSSSASRTPQIHKKYVAAVSGIVLSSILAGIVGGCAWGLLRPKQEVQLIERGQVAVVEGSAQAGFIGVLWFVLIGAILGGGLGLLVLRGRNFNGPSAGLLGVVVAGCIGLICSVVVFVTGQVVAGIRQVDISSLELGQSAQAVPEFSTYSALLVAPLVAMIALWARILFQSEDDPAEHPAE